MNILDRALTILEQPVCDHCLGRQFAQLASGTTNKERGGALRAAAAMSIDRDEEPDVDIDNFADFEFNTLDAKSAKKKCSVCGGLFEKLDKWAGKVGKRAKGVEFETFLVGSRLPFSLIDAEERLWERVGIDHVEPMKAELNREVGKLFEERSDAKFDPKQPDVAFILDVGTGTVKLEINPIFIYGEYQKLRRGIPQTKWPGDKYRTSVEEMIARPVMRAARGASHKFHGMGREDIDARCLGWRPFVLEISEPERRSLDLKKIRKKLPKSVEVRKMRFSDRDEVRRIKESRPDKTYRALVVCRSPFTSLKNLKRLKGTVRQKTPKRVSHRRADRTREREVRSVSTKKKTSRSFVLTVRCEAGTYVKELVSGDDGRTQPSVSQILQNECYVKELDVMKIHNQ